MKKTSCFKTIYDIILDLIYPKHCAVCQKRLTGYCKTALCPDCAHKDYTSKTVRDDRFYFDEAIGMLEYKDTVRESMIKYKFKSIKYYCGAFAEIMSRTIKERPYLAQSVICCVPVSKTRGRDYSQTQVLAEKLSGLWGGKLCTDLLYRRRLVSQLSKMKLFERRFFIKGSIDVNPTYDIVGKDILLIDDIFTSGTTANECARMLKMHGAARVFVLCACYD